LARSTEAIYQMPSFNSDGTRIIFAALLFLEEGALRGDIREIEIASGAVETLVRAESNEVVYFYPRPAPDGRLLVTRLDNMQTVDEKSRLEWVARDGSRTTAANDARDGDVSPDGSRIAFVRTDITTQRSSLWLANSDGTGERELVNDNTFVALLNPRFSPDGAWLAFGVHGTPQTPLPLVSNDCVLPILSFCLVQSAHAHSAPGALWRMNLETGKFQQLTNIYDDSPVPAWARSSAQIAIHDFTGIRLIDLPRQEIYPLFLEAGGSSSFDWHAR
jgi:Tol biopolymer transport system component